MTEQFHDDDAKKFTELSKSCSNKLDITQVDVPPEVIRRHPGRRCEFAN
jgi:hypothetical protein